MNIFTFFSRKDHQINNFSVLNSTLNQNFKSKNYVVRKSNFFIKNHKVALSHASKHQQQNKILIIILSQLLTCSPTLASKRYKQVKFFAPPRPCRKTLRGERNSPRRFLNVLEHSAYSLSIFLSSSLCSSNFSKSPPISVSTNS